MAKRTLTNHQDSFAYVLFFKWFTQISEKNTADNCTNQDIHKVKDWVVCQTDNEDASVRSHKFDARQTDKCTCKSGTYDKAWNCTGWVSSSKRNRTFCDERKPHDDICQTRITFFSSKFIFEKQSCNKYCKRWNHTGCHNRCHDWRTTS